MNDIETITIENECKPLITFALFSYNQEKYIREAIAGALSQTYSPLEIIISDDGSTDQTFEIICELVAAYNGSNKVIINRNKENLGIGKHVNKILALASGELIVLAAGDDISENNRTHEVVNYWLDSNKKIDAIWSNINIINEEGNIIDSRCSQLSNEKIEKQIEKMVPSLIGCSHVTTKRLFNQYGPLREDIVYEDRALAFRAICSGGLGNINKSLVRYRIHGNCISASQRVSAEFQSVEILLKNHLLHLQRELSVINGCQADSCKIHTEELTRISIDQISRALELMLKENMIDSLLCSSNFFSRLSGFSRGFFRTGRPVKMRIKFLVRLIDPKLWFQFRTFWIRRNKYKYKI